MSLFFIIAVVKCSEEAHVLRKRATYLELRKLKTIKWFRHIFYNVLHNFKTSTIKHVKWIFDQQMLEEKALYSRQLFQLMNNLRKQTRWSFNLI